MILVGPCQLKMFPVSFQSHSSKPEPHPAGPPCLALWFCYTKQRLRKAGDASLNDCFSRGAVAGSCCFDITLLVYLTFSKKLYFLFRHRLCISWTHGRCKNNSMSYLHFWREKKKQELSANQRGCPTFNFLLMLNTRLQIVPYKHREAEIPRAALPSPLLYTLNHDSSRVH